MFNAPLPHDEAAETVSFRKAFASAMKKADPVCSPPVVKTALVSGDSGAALVGSILLRRPGVSVLFARSDSCYFDLVADVWDLPRDARGYVGTNPVVAHPPCRGWGRLSHLAKPRADEKSLGLFAVDAIRRCGGVLEHPHASKLWVAAQLPPAGTIDAWGGFTLLVDQGWFGHAAPKPTWLYICGIARGDVPYIPVQLQRAAGRTLRLSPAERERTPPKFARFLVEIAAKCRAPLLHPAVAAVTLTQARCNTELVSGAGAKRAAFRAWAGA